MKHLILFLITSLFSFLLFAQSQYIAENNTLMIEAETLAFLGHATSFWDGSEKTKVATRKLMDIAKSKNIPIVATAARHMLDGAGLEEMHYFKRDEVDVLIESVAGQHKLQIPNVKKIFIVGGNLGRCLCEGIRDLVRGFSDSPNFKVVDLYLIRDGIYDGYPKFSPMLKEAAIDYVQNFWVESFKCPLQNWYLFPRLKLSEVRLDLYYDKELLKSYDLEPKDENLLQDLSKEINVHFITSSELENYF